MDHELRQVINEAVAKAVKETVNGKIDALSRKTDALSTKIDDHNTKHEADMEEMKPFMQGAAGIQVLWKLFVGVGSLAVAYLAIKNVLR